MRRQKTLPGPQAGGRAGQLWGLATTQGLTSGRLLKVKVKQPTPKRFFSDKGSGSGLRGQPPEALAVLSALRGLTWPCGQGQRRAEVKTGVSAREKHREGLESPAVRQGLCWVRGRCANRARGGSYLRQGRHLRTGARPSSLGVAPGAQPKGSRGRGRAGRGRCDRVQPASGPAARGGLACQAPSPSSPVLPGAQLQGDIRTGPGTRAPSVLTPTRPRPLRGGFPPCAEQQHEVQGSPGAAAVRGRALFTAAAEVGRPTGIPSPRPQDRIHLGPTGCSEGTVAFPSSLLSLQPSRRRGPSVGADPAPPSVGAGHPAPRAGAAPAPPRPRPRRSAPPPTTPPRPRPRALAFGGTRGPPRTASAEAVAHGAAATRFRSSSAPGWARAMPRAPAAARTRARP